MTTISVSQAIRNAVEAELAAARFYRLLAESTADPEARRFLSDLAEQEVGHAQSIEQAAQAVIDGPLPARADGNVEMIETLPTWRFADDVSFANALEIAIAAEIQAALYYDAFSDQFQGAAKQFFADLARTEEKHASEVVRRREKLGQAG